MKHIEQILPEYAAGEISRLLVADDDATATAALTRLLHDWTGCDIPQTSALPESEVEELVPLCVSILRRHWQTPLTCLGDGTTPMSLADLLRQLIDGRVNGNEALGIPPANANIPAALTALSERHIADGLTLTLSDGTTTELPDGISLAQFLCTTLTDTITELKDDNVGWTFNVSNELLTLMRQFLKLERVTFGCKEITQCIFNTANYKEMNTRTMIMHFPNLKTIFNGCVFYNYEGVSGHDNNVGYSEAHLDVLEETNMPNNGGGAFKTTKLYMPSFKKGLYRFGGSSSYANLTTLYMYLGCQGSKTDTIILTDYLYGGYKNNLEDLEIRDGACQNLTLSGPFNSLTPENMYNHILCRLKQDDPMCGEGVTITLGTTNLDKLEAVEEYNLKLTELTDTYGYTFA